MTAQSKSTLKTYFETGDYPNQAEFADLVDSLALDADVSFPIEVRSAASGGSGLTDRGRVEDSA